MSGPPIAPTRSHLLELRRQLAFALEGYELLDQKRQLLTLELVARAERLGRAEGRLAEALARARAALREATLDSGSAALDRLAAGVPPAHEVALSEERLMGLRLPRVELRGAPPPLRSGLAATSPAADVARQRFAEVLALLAEVAGLQNAVLRLSRELRRTQRRCNALTKLVIPDRRRAIHFIAGALEEREREAFVDRKLRGGR